MFTLENIDDIIMFDHAYFREGHHYTIKIFQSIGLLHEYRKCACGEITYLYKRKDTGDGVEFKCYSCSKRYVLRKDSIFEMCNLPLYETFILMVCFIKYPALTYDDLLNELDIGSFTSNIEWKIIIPYSMASKLYDFLKIGGPGKIVQIDETAVCKNKYNIGRILKNQQYWMIGGTDVDGNYFLKISKVRNKQYLEEIIIENVEEGNTIWTDGWRGYNSFADLGFTYGPVNHKRHFDSPTGIHTNRIEATWGAFKRKYRNITNKTLETLPEYVADLLFRRRYSKKEIIMLRQFIMNFYMQF